MLSKVVQAGSGDDRAKPAAASARFGHPCRRLRSLVVLQIFGHISDTNHNSDISRREVDKVERYDRLFLDIICLLA